MMGDDDCDGGGTDDMNRTPRQLRNPHINDEYTVYPSRWIMLGYMSILNLMSDWTCYSVAPIAKLTIDKYGGDVDPEVLVTVFLLANTVASALEPAILGRLGLRRTILFGASLLMVGSIVKSGGLRSVLVADDLDYNDNDEGLDDGGRSGGGGRRVDGSWGLYLGFFLVGLSQPLYQCTPALLSASWFPENERTMATGVALNSNQLGIGCAFVFGTMLVTTEDDITPYFGLLSLISTIAFVGVALQFDDAPPTPPSDSARVIRGDLEIKIPRWMPFAGRLYGGGGGRGGGAIAEKKDGGGDNDDDAREKRTRTRTKKRKKKKSIGGAAAEASAAVPGLTGESTGATMRHNEIVVPPSPPCLTDEAVGVKSTSRRPPGHDDRGVFDPTVAPLRAQPNHPLASAYPHPYHAPPAYYPSDPFQGMGYTSTTPAFFHGYDQEGHYRNSLLETSPWYDGHRHSFCEGDDEGVEPIMTQLDHHLDIDIRDDQIIQQFKACFRRRGFTHCVVAFTTSGIIINTLSTFMDYLVTLNGAGREYVGIVGGTFQILIMCSSLVFGGWTDASRKYYLVTLVMLTFGTFALAVCNVDLDSDAGGDLRWNLLVVAVLAGPLQPISTELG
jgi:MFS family permease